MTEKSIVVIRIEKVTPATHLLALNAFTYNPCIIPRGRDNILRTESIYFKYYFGSDANEIAETPASLAPSITLIIVSATAFSSA